ncbi:MAG: sigma-70 family RNA polymerase sigma factor [Chloroflexi bacterium]|nr:sigma-70 family RNA polymerase sigma factor [Chloroflexota bacterium]
MSANQTAENPNPEPTLVSAAQRGDREAFARLYEENIDKVYRYLRARLNEPADAEDVAAVVFIKAMQGLPSYQDRGAPFVAWLLRIAHNEMVSFVRKRSRRREASLEGVDVASDDPTDLVLAMVESTEVRRAMKQLTDLQQQVLALRFGSELSIQETVTAMNRKDGAVKFLQHSAVQALRRALEAEGYERNN